MKSLLTTLTLTLTISLSTQFLGAREPLDKPNIVIIYLDDSGYGDYSHNGNPVIETPTISKLAAEGVSFTQFYVTTAACSASRYSLLTGRYPGRSGLGSWVVGPGTKNHILPQEVTLAEGLKSVGYQTGMFGKWHLGSPNEKNKMSQDTLPLAHGFDTWVGTNVSHDYGNAMCLRSDPNGDFPLAGYSLIAKNLPSDEAASKSLTKLYTDAAVEYIKSNKDKPFFAYLAYNQPHLGLYVADEFKGKSRRGMLGDVMAELDYSIKLIMTTLEEQGISKNTLIIFSSDNGPWILFQNSKNHPKYGEARLHVGYAYPFRDGKGSTWEGGHRVPGIFYWPGVIGAKRELAPVSTLDVLPTVFALAGVELPKDRSMDGRDIRKLLAPDRFKLTVKPFELLYSHSSNTPFAIRKGPWKLHVRIGSQIGNQSKFKPTKEKPILFNVEQDLYERIDRAAEHPEKVKELLALLEAKQKQIEQEGTLEKK